jgi:hypothetical protein
MAGRHAHAERKKGKRKKKGHHTVPPPPSPPESPPPHYSNDAPLAAASGDITAMALYAGQDTGLATRVQPAAEIVREVSEVSEEAVRALASIKVSETS